MALTELHELVLNVDQPLVMARTSNATTEYWTTYKHFIDNLRRRYPPLSALCGSLAFNIVLKSNSHQIKLRLDRCAFCLRGYQMETPQQWLEFGAGSSCRDPLDCYIAGSSSLEIHSGYEQLEEKCGQKIESIRLGQQQLTAAVDLLATSTRSRDRAKSLIIVSLMICEGIRFTQFCDHVAARFHDNLPTPQWMRRKLGIRFADRGVTELDQCIRPDGENLDHIPRPSETISNGEALDGIDWYLSSETDSLESGSGDKEIPDANLMGHAHQTAYTDLVACDEEDYDCHHSGEGNSDIISVPFEGKPSDVSADDDKTSDADPPRLLQPVIGVRSSLAFAEVFFVRVSSTKGMRPCSFYGAIKVDEFGVSQNIYDRGPKQSEFIQPGDLILLTGPVKPINVTDGFIFSLALMGESFRDFMSFYACNGKFDELIYDEFYAEHCSVSVFYIAFQTAMRATVKVTFIDKDMEGHARLYGHISARCGKFGYEIVLFQRKAEEHMNVRPGRAITLLRNVISVPWGSRLVLGVDLFGYSETCFDQDIAKCVLEFPLECIAGSPKLFEKIMYRESGKIRVNVVWNSR